jgi:hypothetical protein
VISVKYNQNNQVKEGEIGRICSIRGKKTNACTVLAGKPKGNTLLGRVLLSWEDSIKMNLREIG